MDNENMNAKGTLLNVWSNLSKKLPEFNTYQIFDGRFQCILKTPDGKEYTATAKTKREAERESAKLALSKDNSTTSTKKTSSSNKSFRLQDSNDNDLMLLSEISEESAQLLTIMLSLNIIRGKWV